MVKKKYTEQQELMLHWYKDTDKGAQARAMLRDIHPGWFDNNSR